MSHERSVYITGLGPISAMGVGMDAHWSGMQDGRSSLRRLSLFDPSGFDCQVAGELSDDEFSVRKCVPKSYRKAVKVMCRDIELAVGAADAAVNDAGLTTGMSDDPPSIDPSRFGCQIGAGLIAADVNELTAALVTSQVEDGRFDIGHWGSEGMQNLTPLWLLKYLPNMLACHVTIIHQLRGPSNTITCCEASALLSMGESMRVIQRGDADACLTGGAEFKLNPMAYMRQQFANRLATTGADADGEDAWTVVQPFGRHAGGTVLGEGGGLIVLESAESAAKRGVTPYAEVLAISATQSMCLDSTGLDYAPDDHSVSNVIEAALEQAGIDAASIDAIVPFGSGISNSDQAEANAITAVFGDRARSIPIVTTVPFTGNCNAGNAAIAVSVAAKCLREQALPARLAPEETLDGLDAGPVGARAASLRHVLVMTTSQGGQNCAAVLRRIDT